MPASHAACLPHPAVLPPAPSAPLAGGADSILLVAGTDATDEFNAIHSAKAKAMLLDYYIGDVAPEGADLAAAAAAGSAAGAAAAAAASAAAAAPPMPAYLAAVAGAPAALNPKKRQLYTLVEKEALSHNVRRFRFALQSPAHRFGLPVGKHVFLYAK